MRPEAGAERAGQDRDVHTSPAEPVTPDPPRAVASPVMTQRWADLTYLHWPYDAAVVAPFLPPGTRPDLAEGSAWVGLVPFAMRDVRFPVRPPGGRTARGLPAPPPLGSFAETNVRTYSIGPDGRRGVVFLSLDASRALPVLVARTVFALPYHWSRLRVERTGQVGSGPEGSVVTYTCRRRAPGPRGARSLVRVRVGRPVEPAPLDDFLTARWGLHTWRRGRAVYGAMEHPRWPLHSAELLDLDDDLVPAAGLPAPDGPPRVLFSPGVDVRVGWPRPAGRG